MADSQLRPGDYAWLVSYTSYDALDRRSVGRLVIIEEFQVFEWTLDGRALISSGTVYDPDDDHRYQVFNPDFKHVSPLDLLGNAADERA